MQCIGDSLRKAACSASRICGSLKKNKTDSKETSASSAPPHSGAYGSSEARPRTTPQCAVLAHAARGLGMVVLPETTLCDILILIGKPVQASCTSKVWSEAMRSPRLWAMLCVQNRLCRQSQLVGGDGFRDWRELLAKGRGCASLEGW